MSEIQKVVNEYFKKKPISTGDVISNYKKLNRVKLLDDVTKDAYILDVDSAKLYIEKLMIK